MRTLLVEPDSHSIQIAGRLAAKKTVGTNVTARFHYGTMGRVVVTT
jgi:hypothetical protein